MSTEWGEIPKWAANFGPDPARLATADSACYFMVDSIATAPGAASNSRSRGSSPKGVVATDC